MLNRISNCKGSNSSTISYVVSTQVTFSQLKLEETHAVVQSICKDSGALHTDYSISWPAIAELPKEYCCWFKYSAIGLHMPYNLPSRSPPNLGLRHSPDASPTFSIDLPTRPPKKLPNAISAGHIIRTNAHLRLDPTRGPNASWEVLIPGEVIGQPLQDMTKSKISRLHSGHLIGS